MHLDVTVLLSLCNRCNLRIQLFNGPRHRSVRNGLTSHGAFLCSFLIHEERAYCQEEASSFLYSVSSGAVAFLLQRAKEGGAILCSSLSPPPHKKKVQGSILGNSTHNSLLIVTISSPNVGVWGHTIDFDPAVVYYYS